MTSHTYIDEKNGVLSGLPTILPEYNKNPMSSVRFTDDRIVKRLRWIMLGVMLFSVINTLIGQPKSFWYVPESAIRGDGLSIHNSTNPTFEFFLGHGWQSYLAASLLYLTAAFLIVSLLPRRSALVTAFSFILGHYFGGSNWIAVRWHLGVAGPTVYGILLSAIMALFAFSEAEVTDAIVSRLRWVMLATMLLDYTITLAGQPGSFWHHPETMRESNQLARLFLGHGWPGYLLYAVLLVLGTFLLLRVFPRTIALICVFATTLGGFLGSSNWLFFDWRMGMQTPVIYGIVLSLVIVAFVIPAPKNKAERLPFNMRGGSGKPSRGSNSNRLGCLQSGC
ncbi:MAG: hypothetical protein ABR987_22410 [Terracidiphilus sp.]